MGANVENTIGHRNSVPLNWTFPAQPDGILVIWLLSRAGSHLATVTLGGIPAQGIVTTTPAGTFVADMAVFSLTDQTSVSITSDQYHVADILIAATVSGTTLIPTDYDEIFDHETSFPDPPETGTWTALDPGLILAIGAVYDSGGADITVLPPAGFTTLETASNNPSFCFAKGTVTAAGAQPSSVFVATMGTDSSSTALFLPTYDLAGRIRDGGGWITGGSAGNVGPGAPNLPNRQFPPDPELPNLPPEPTPIRLPKRPWTKPSGGGQYRNP